MKAEKPAEGILKQGDFGDAVFYKVECQCGDPDHEIVFEVEADETGVNVNSYVTAKTDYWSELFKKRHDIDNEWLQEFDWLWKELVNGLYRRLRWTWKIWTRGYVKTSTTIAMTEQQAFNYSNALTSAIEDVKVFRNKRVESKK